MKVAELKGDPKCKGLLAISLYHQKPVYLLSNNVKTIEWVKKARKVYHNGRGKVIHIHYHWLNVINDYNFNMNNVDMTDHVYRSYAIDAWMRKRKWR